MHPGIRNLVIFLFTLCIYILFITMCSVVMMQTEKPFEDEWRLRMRELKLKLSSFSCVESSDVEELITEVEYGMQHGFSAEGNPLEREGWTFGNAVLFTISIGTTVGYGHLAPSTNSGKVMTAIITATTVPLTLLLTTVLVIRLIQFTRRWKLYLEEKIGSKIGLFATRLLHLCLVFVCVLSFFIIIAAVIFQKTEPTWNIYESLYFSIISVSTVGLGDYVPGGSVDGLTREIYLVFCSVFLVIGVVFALLVLETMYEIPELGIHIYLLPADEEEEKGDIWYSTQGSEGVVSNSTKEKLIKEGTALPSYGVK